MELKTRTIKQIFVIPASPNEVYDAIMDPDKHMEFTEDTAEGSSEIGGMFYAYDGYITAKNLELEKGKRIVQEWRTSEWPEDYPPSNLEIRLKEVEGGTELSMIHSQVPDEQADDYAEGWKEHYWHKLQGYFRKKKGGKRRA